MERNKRTVTVNYLQCEAVGCRVSASTVDAVLHRILVVVKKMSLQLGDSAVFHTTSVENTLEFKSLKDRS